MPILGYETHGNRKRLARAFKETYEGPRPKSHEHERRETQCTANEALLLGYQATRYPAYPRRRQVHPRQTLQRFGYSMITSTEARDRDQVSFRWAAAVGGRRLRKKSFRPVIMVDQLWLWMLEDGTLITCCPEASALGWISDQRTRGDLSGSNLSRLYDLGLLAGSGTEVMTQVVSHLVLRELIDFGGKWGPMDFRFEDGFRASINRIVRPASTDPHLTPMPIDDHSTCQVEHENSLFRRFTAATRLSHEASGNGAKENDDDFLNRSDLETNLLVELMAIQDELNIIQTVLTQQRTVLEELRRIYQGSRSKQNGDFDCLLGRQLDGEDEKSRNLELMRGTFEVLDKNAAVVEHLLADAAKVQRSVESLLTFKQMHANTAEARLRRKKEETAERSENTLKAFGLISLLFLPLSFASSLFALDVDVFPKDEAGEKSWPIRQVMGLIFGISAAILVILVTSSVFINEILAFSRHWRQSLLTSISITTTANPPNTTSEPARPAHDSDSDSDPETLYSSDSTSELSSSDGEYESDSVISSSLSEEEEESAAAAGSSAAPPPRSSSAGDIQPDSVVGSSDPEEEEKGSEHVPAAESSTQPPTPPPAPVPLLMSAVDRLRRRGRRQEAAIDVDVEKGVVSSAGKQEVGGSLQ
ncbi:hypothetical protein B0T18DRAFT_159335 [Schizothecium vesticola]|uniref:Uncharacterized protein n=1 Tax=Schizothecium vesticola TaxID=314040 RepID=A0AA40EWG6_9PEZI|nr:hypothetical protein B0T18DRAFT_159335 [Schizothecium vesticola]